MSLFSQLLYIPILQFQQCWGWWCWWCMIINDVWLFCVIQGADWCPGSYATSRENWAWRAGKTASSRGGGSGGCSKAASEYGANHNTLSLERREQVKDTVYKDVMHSFVERCQCLRGIRHLCLPSVRCVCKAISGDVCPCIQLFCTELSSYWKEFLFGIFINICLSLQTFGWNWTKITGTSHEDLGIFVIISYHSWNTDKRTKHWEARVVVHNLNIIFFNIPFHTNACARTHTHRKSFLLQISTATFHWVLTTCLFLFTSLNFFFNLFL